MFNPTMLFINEDGEARRMQCPEDEIVLDPQITTAEELLVNQKILSLVKGTSDSRNQEIKKLNNFNKKFEGIQLQIEA